MASRILKREAAKRDLIAQWVWYAENIGIEVADRFFASSRGHTEAPGPLKRRDYLFESGNCKAFAARQFKIFNRETNMMRSLRFAYIRTFLSGCGSPIIRIPDERI